MRNLYLIVGRSGSGKSTVADLLSKRYGLKAVSSYTTRPPRYIGEQGHLFVSKEEFDQLNLVAYTKFDDYEYGITSDILDQSDLYVIDLDGVEILKQKYNHKKLFVFDLIASDDILRLRMRSRGDSEYNIEKRLINDQKMFEKEKIYKFDALIDANLPATIVVDTIYNFIKKYEDIL